MTYLAFHLDAISGVENKIENNNKVNKWILLFIDENNNPECGLQSSVQFILYSPEIPTVFTI